MSLAVKRNLVWAVYTAKRGLLANFKFINVGFCQNEVFENYIKIFWTVS